MWKLLLAVSSLVALSHGQPTPVLTGDVNGAPVAAADELPTTSGHARAYALRKKSKSSKGSSSKKLSSSSKSKSGKGSSKSSSSSSSSKSSLSSSESAPSPALPAGEAPSGTPPALVLDSTFLSGALAPYDEEEDEELNAPGTTFTGAGGAVEESTEVVPGTTSTDADGSGNESSGTTTDTTTGSSPEGGSGVGGAQPDSSQKGSSASVLQATGAGGQWIDVALMLAAWWM